MTPFFGFSNTVSWVLILLINNPFVQIKVPGANIPSVSKKRLLAKRLSKFPQFTIQLLNKSISMSNLLLCARKKVLKKRRKKEEQDALCSSLPCCPEFGTSGQVLLQQQFELPNDNLSIGISRTDDLTKKSPSIGHSSSYTLQTSQKILPCWK